MATLPDIRSQFPEPIVEVGADPYVIEHGDDFFYTRVIKDAAIYMAKSRDLPDMGKQPLRQVWKPEPGYDYSQCLWAPELHRLDDRWYIYFTAGQHTEHYDNQRSYVLEGTGEDPRECEYVIKGKIADSSDEWAIDGTVMQHNKQNYFIWSGREHTADRTQHLYIAPMANPWTLAADRIKISSPTYPWEQKGAPINEGPESVRHGDRQHIIFSASASFRNDYCLGQLTLTGDDPLNPDHWQKRPEPVFASQGSIIAPGHASFILAPDETSGWMAYHSARRKNSGWDRQVRLRAFTLSEDGDFTFLPDRADHKQRAARRLSALLRPQL